jgi:hypothetical protein
MLALRASKLHFFFTKPLMKMKYFPFLFLCVRYDYFLRLRIKYTETVATITTAIKTAHKTNITGKGSGSGTTVSFTLKYIISEATVFPNVSFA